MPNPNTEDPENMSVEEPATPYMQSGKSSILVQRAVSDEELAAHECISLEEMYKELQQRIFDHYHTK